MRKQTGALPWLTSFGRRKSRALTPRKAELMESLLPQLLIDLDNAQSENYPIQLAKQYAEIWLEIGFGGGEHLAAQALANTNVLCIGCEPFIDGVAKLLVEVEDNALTNVRILTDDARLIMQKLPDASISRLFILFPDPWPKQRHNNRRIVKQETLEMASRILKKGGELRLVTDHADYAAWMLKHVHAHNGFEWQHGRECDWQTPPDDWVPTRYESKTRAQGREPVYYLLKKK